MDLIFRIVYAAHANGTHHKLALDALRFLSATDADAWRKVFLKHAELYLEGSKAPDTEFKDFKNHVLHVRDGYWGGAPEKVQSWYGHLVDALRHNDWAQAAYAAGVLSHYVTDPIHPFHTAQSEAENNIHRAVEWSINRGYDALWAAAAQRHSDLTVAVPGGAAWLKDLTLAGAETSNKIYEKLIAHYDIHRGVTDPPTGLDAIAADDIGRLMIYASRSFAVVLDRAIAESGAAAPEIALGLDTLLATLKIPVKWVTKRLADAADRRLVEAQYDELMATGRVDKTLAEDDRMVRDLFDTEILAPRKASEAKVRSDRLANPPVAARTAAPKAVAPAAPVGGQTAPRAAPAQMPGVSASAATATTHGATSAEPAPPAAATTAPGAQSRSRRILKLDDDVEAAPSIGPVMAERLSAFGVDTIAALLACEPAVVVASLGDQRITEPTVRDWQAQTRLVLDIPSLRGGHAQLLVGAGYRDVAAIAATPPDKLCAGVLSFAVTDAGRRILRDAAAPDMETIVSWSKAAQGRLAA